MVGSFSKTLAIWALGIALVACADDAAGPDAPEAEQVMAETEIATGGFSERLSAPRLPLITKETATPEQRAMLESRADYNIYKTLAHHPKLYTEWSPLGQALLNNENISPRHREIAMLRMGWLCQAPYEWAQHARIAYDSVGMSEEEIRAIAVGADAPIWSDIDRAVIRMAEEIRYQAMISDETWAALGETYTDEQIIELMFTASQYHLVSMVLNGLGIQLDDVLTFRLPDDLPLPALAGVPTSPRRAEARVPILPVAEMTADQQEMVAAQLSTDGQLPNAYAALANSPNIYPAKARFGAYLAGGTDLPPAIRELVILRTAYLTNTPYLWAHHVSMGLDAGLTQEHIEAVKDEGVSNVFDPAQAAVVAMATELRQEAFVTDATYAQLKEHFTDQQIVELLFTVGGMTMSATMVNSLGVPLESGILDAE